MERYINMGEGKIIRDNYSCMLIDEDGDEILKVPSYWTDTQVWKTLEIANQFYDRGVRVGMFIKKKQIREVLDI